MKFAIRFHAATVALAAALAVAGLSARAEDITAAVRTAGKATITAVSGRVTSGTLANAFDGTHTTSFCLMTASEEGFTPPSEENPIIVDYVIADDFRPGEDIIASRFVVFGCYNSTYKTSAPLKFEIYGSSDGEDWHKLTDDRRLPHPANGYANSLIVPMKNRASYRRYRFKFTENNGYAGTDRGQLYLLDLRIYSSGTVIYVAPDGSNDADGLSWATATTPTNAVRLANASSDFTEIHCNAGRYMLPAACSYTKRVLLIGGFVGDTSNPLALDPTGARSIYDGGGTVSFGFYDATSTGGNYNYWALDFIENMEFTGMTEAALYVAASKSPPGVDCHNCRFVANRSAAGARGAYLSGQQLSLVTSYTSYSFYDCEISGNGFSVNNTVLSSTYSGNGLYAANGHKPSRYRPQKRP